MRKVYFISGLGANEKVFQYLKLPGIEPVYLNWLPPMPHETLAQYALRLSKGITTPNPVIIGLSFGGMVALEIARLMPVQMVILVSSAKNSSEIPFYFRLGRYLPLHKVLPLTSLAGNKMVMRLLFGVRNKMAQQVMQSIMQNNVTGFNNWAINQVVHLPNLPLPCKVIHIHGTADRLLPYRYVHADYAIKGGTHFMIATKARQVSQIINRLLNQPGL
jgi:pimeloyl-ACP methyl ester carboxylesterase